MYSKAELYRLTKYESENTTMTHEAIITHLREAHDLISNLADDANFKKFSVYDEMQNAIISVINTLHKLDDIADTKNTREIFYLTTEYRYSDVENRVFLTSHFAHSLHELREMHIYELTLDRCIQDRTLEALTVDYTHKVIVIADFDFNNCTNEQFKADFKDELADSFFNCMFDTLNYSMKQLS